MIDTKAIRQTLNKYFHIEGRVKIDSAGRVSVLARPSQHSVHVKVMRQTRLPVEFDRIEGDFDASKTGITTMWGFPITVTGHLYVYTNPDLHQFSDYEPVSIGHWWAVYRRDLKILKMLAAKEITLFTAPLEVEEIMNRYAGQGKSGALKCAAELIKAGFRDNARW